MSLESLIFNIGAKRSDKKRDAAIPLPTGVTECRNISYGPHGQWNLLDVYYPDGTSDKLPTIVSIHGGGYVYGSKEIYRRYGMDMAKRGFTFVNFNYRLAPKWKFPAPLADTNAVLRWVHANAKRYHLDPERIILVGDSAGAQLASQYAAIHTDPEYASLFGLKRDKVTIRALGLNCGVYDMAKQGAGKRRGLILDYLGKEIPADDLASGDVVIVRPGSSIPADGVVLDGNGVVDESSVTGESVPAGKAPGDRVVSGTMNMNGSFRFRADRVGRDSTLSRIISLVENASNSSAPISRFADRVSGFFVPAVLMIAIGAGCFWLIWTHDVYFSLTTAISVLVISCPCALGLATPIAIMVGTGVGSKYGILFKNAAALEELHAVKTVVLDKTGTVTEGRHRVTRVAAFAPDGTETDGGEKELLRIAVPLESKSEHPFARAVVQYAKERGEDAPDADAEDFLAVPGMGVYGRVGGVRYACGNARLMDCEGIRPTAQEALVRELENSGCSLLFMADCDAKRLCGIMALRDTVKEGSADALRALHELGLKTVLLTGDTEASAATVASELKIDRVIAGVLPDGKEERIRELQQGKGRVAMVGDGINDAAALVRANVGIAIGSGTDIALETADVVLLRSDLRDVVTAIRLSRAVMRNIRLNLFWAFFYNVLGIPIAAGALYPAFGWQMSPMIGTAAMACSSLFVVTNALRLRKFR